jgi:peroxiredoxin
MLEPGAPAPAIDLPDLDGNQWTLEDALRRGPVVLVFFKISCLTCQLTLPFLQRLVDSEHPVVPQLIAISQDDAADTRLVQEQFGISMPTLLDKGPLFAASNAYRITSVPAIFVIETGGRVSSAVDGFNKAALEKLGERYKVTPFRATDQVPALRPG